MNKLFLPLLLLVVALLVSCSPEMVPTPFTESSTPTIPLSPAATLEPVATLPSQPMPSLTPTLVKPAATNTATRPPEFVFRYQSLDISPSLPVNVPLTGALVILDDPHYILNLEQGSKQELPEKTLCFSTSPDGQWLAYCQYEEEVLIIQSANGQEVITLPVGEDWWLSGSAWLDNQRLVFNLFWKDETEIKSIRPVVVVNPFTGETLELASDYPDLKPRITGAGGGTMHFNYSTVVYHPSLNNLVIYPKTTADGAFVTLWDRQAEEVLASVRDLGEFGRLPLWTPDGSEFVVAVIHQGGKATDEFRAFIEEWFSVTSAGEIQQLTHFGNFFDHVEIYNAKWAPDGQRLAFWLRTIPSECGEGQYLAVLERETSQVTNYCIFGSIYDAHPPVWSLDGKYIAVGSNDGIIRQVILVSIEEGWAAQISEDVTPVGWLVSP